MSRPVALNDSADVPVLRLADARATDRAQVRQIAVGTSTRDHHPPAIDSAALDKIRDAGEEVGVAISAALALAGNILAAAAASAVAGDVHDVACFQQCRHHD